MSEPCRCAGHYMACDKPCPDYWDRSNPAFVRAVEAEAARYHASECLFLPDLRQRITKAIDQAWAEKKDSAAAADYPAYHEGYLDGLEAAERIANETPLRIASGGTDEG